MPGLEPTALDNAVNTVTADNLDLGCRMIEKAAHDKAITDIDARLAAGYSVSVDGCCWAMDMPACSSRATHLLLISFPAVRKQMLPHGKPIA